MSRRPQRPRPQIRRVLTVAAILVAILACGHYWRLYSDLKGAKTELTTAQAALKPGLDVSATDLAATRAHLAVARDDVRGARRQLAYDPLFQGAHLVPGLRDQARAGDDFIDMADL